MTMLSLVCSQGLEDAGSDYLGTVKSNYLGTEFSAYEEWVGGPGTVPAYCFWLALLHA